METETQPTTLAIAYPLPADHAALLHRALDSLSARDPLTVVLVPTTRTEEDSVLVQAVTDAIAQVYVALAAAAARHGALDWITQVLVAGLADPSLLANPTVFYVLASSDAVLVRVSSWSEAVAAINVVNKGGPEVAWRSLASADIAAVGGTFDHLHAGHKLLLAATALRTRSTVVLGVVADALLAHKQCAAEMEPYSQRVAAAAKYLTEFAPYLAVEVVELTDAFGPAATRPDMDLLVATVETAANSGKVNDERAKRGLRPIAIELIPVISDKSSTEAAMSAKISSTTIRQWLTACHGGAH
ncbi:hypothetical protein BC828DRAFT_402985 [Blastocladiella britannica]|nr:hypothetical protein BC828DRAFT_402985 [Blastocladiella britannica]